MRPVPMPTANSANAAALSIQPGNGRRWLAAMMLGRARTSGTAPRRRARRCSVSDFVNV